MPRYAIIDDTDPGLVYKGEWRLLTDPVYSKAPEYKGTTHVTNDPTATVTYQFYGAELGVFGTLDTPKGLHNASFSVTPNAVPLTHFNQTGNVPRLWDTTVPTTHVELFTSDRLATGTYTMTITAEGVSQGGAAFYLDFLTVLLPDDVNTGAERVIVDDADTQWKFQGAWTATRIPGNYLTTIHQTHPPGMSATLSFEGTDITVYGTINGRYSDLKPLGYFQVDNGENLTVVASDIPNEITLNDGSILRNQQLFSATGLAPGQHTLTVVVPPNAASPTSSTSPNNPDWYLDYAVYGPVGSGSSNPSSPSPPPSAPPNVGAIAGGVVGGVVILGALVAAFILWRRKKRRSNLDAKTAAPGEYLLDTPAPVITPYQTSTAPSSSPFIGRSTSMHKPLAEANVNPTYGHTSDPEGSLLGGSTATGSLSPKGRNQQAGTSRTTGSGTGSGSVTEMTTVSTESSAVRPSNRRRRREQDGGVRLASASDDEGDILEDDEEVLPPRYERY